MEFADNLKKYRSLKGLTQKELAEKAGLAEITIRKYESKKFVPKPEQALKLSNALGIDSIQLMGSTYIDIMHPEINESVQKHSAFITFLESLGYYYKSTEEYSVRTRDDINRNTPVSFVFEMLLNNGSLGVSYVKNELKKGKKSIQCTDKELEILQESIETLIDGFFYRHTKKEKKAEEIRDTTMGSDYKYNMILDSLFDKMNKDIKK